MKTQTLRQTVTFAAPPHEVFETLMDPRKHARVTGGPARISRKVGGVFSAFDGELSGTTLELIADRKIVWSWRAADWPAGHHSRATFTLSPAPTGTRLNLRQSGVPAKHAADIRAGWTEYYWKPMKAAFKGGRPKI